MFCFTSNISTTERLIILKMVHIPKNYIYRTDNVFNQNLFTLATCLPCEDTTIFCTISRSLVVSKLLALLVDGIIMDQEALTTDVFQVYNFFTDLPFPSNK